MRKILILGGTGAMGTFLVGILSKKQENLVYVTSRSPHTSTGTINYIQGNARDENIIKDILKDGYDVIIDFMNYDYNEYVSRHKILLASTSQYIWFSSCRVYADSPAPLTERSPRLLETSSDMDFLATNRYALRKARQEDLITSSGFSNYTIIRPYITYSPERLQLGIYEKEQWLYRLLKGRDIVINKAILDKTTAMTYGYDVSSVISETIFNESAMGVKLQIATSETMTWRKICELYLKVLADMTNIKPKVYLCNSMHAIDELYEGGYNTIYDRAYNRSFISERVENVIGHNINYTQMKEGLVKCLKSFLKERKFLQINWQFEAYQDMLLEQYADDSEFMSSSDKETYLHYRNNNIISISGLERKLELVDFETY